MALYFAVENDAYDCDGAFLCGYASQALTGAIDHISRNQAETFEFAMLFPPRLDSRIVAQHAILTIRNQSDKSEMFSPLDDMTTPWSQQHIRKFRIPGTAKSEIYRQLISMGISRDSLFPDLQGVGGSVRKDYFAPWGFDV